MGGKVGGLIDQGAGRTLYNEFIEHALVTVLRHVLMEQIDDIELLAEFGRQAHKLGLDRAVPLEGKPTVFLGRFRVSPHRPILHVLNERTASVDDDGLVSSLCRLDVGKHFFVGLADGRILAMRGVDTRHSLVCVDKQNVRRGECQRGLTRSREAADNHNDVLVGEVHLRRFHNGH